MPCVHERGTRTTTDDDEVSCVRPRRSRVSAVRWTIAEAVVWLSIRRAPRTLGSLVWTHVLAGLEAEPSGVARSFQLLDVEVEANG